MDYNHCIMSSWNDEDMGVLELSLIQYGFTDVFIVERSRAETSRVRQISLRFVHLLLRISGSTSFLFPGTLEYEVVLTSVLIVKSANNFKAPAKD